MIDADFRDGRTHQTKSDKCRQYDGKLFAILLRSRESQFLIRGIANFCGQAGGLKIRPENDALVGRPEFILGQDDLADRITTDRHYGCDYFLLLEN